MLAHRKVEWKKSAARSLRRTDRSTANRIVDAVVRYAETGYGDVVPLKGRKGEYRLRVGAWRVIFTVDVGASILAVLRVAPRGGAWKHRRRKQLPAAA